MSTKSIYINQFDGGQVGDPRDERNDTQRLIKHFDNYTRQFKASPYRGMVLDAVTESTLNGYGIQKFVVTNSGIFSVGYVSASDGHTQIYSKTTLTDPTAVWTTAPGTSTSSSSVEAFIQPVVYHNYIYGVNGAGVWKYGDISSGGSETFTYNEYTSHIPTAQGLVHSKDDTMYWPSNNLILSNLNGSWNVALTLPTNSVINSICEYGNYLAIAADQPDGTCTVYLWDRNASLSTLPEIIHWGAGSLKLIEVVAGVLCGVSTTGGAEQSLTPHLLIKYYASSQVQTLQEFVCTLITVGTVKQIFNNIFYFLAEVTIDGTAYKGLWKVFKNRKGSLAFSFDTLPRNDTALNSGSLHGFIRWGDYIFISYNNPADADKYTIWRTNDQASYTATSIIESTVNPNMPVADRGQLKKLMSFGATYEALPSGAQVVGKWRVNGGSWNTAFTETTTGGTRTEPVAINGGDGSELEFRLESTGGAEITGYMYKYEVIPTNQ